MPNIRVRVKSITLNFMVQVTMPNQKRMDKSAEEFGESLMVFLGKKEEKAILEYDRLASSLEKMLTGC